jgi:hypothetical protein
MNVSAPSTAYTLGYPGPRTVYDAVRQVHHTRVHRRDDCPTNSGGRYQSASLQIDNRPCVDTSAGSFLTGPYRLLSPDGGQLLFFRTGLNGLIVNATKDLACTVGFSLTRLSDLLPPASFSRRWVLLTYTADRHPSLVWE